MPEDCIIETVWNTNNILFAERVSIQITTVHLHMLFLDGAYTFSGNRPTFHRARRPAKASIVTVFNYSSIIWATLFGWLIWNEWPLPEVIAGGAIVIASNLLMVWREARARRAAIS